jgi:hypothetical protein
MLLILTIFYILGSIAFALYIGLSIYGILAYRGMVIKNHKPEFPALDYFLLGGLLLYLGVSAFMFSKEMK